MEMSRLRSPPPSKGDFVNFKIVLPRKHLGNTVEKVTDWILCRPETSGGGVFSEQEDVFF